MADINKIRGKTSMNTVIQINDTNIGMGIAIAGVVILVLVFIFIIICNYKSSLLDESLAACVCAFIAILTGVLMVFIGLDINDDSRMKNIREAIETKYPDAVIIDMTIENKTLCGTFQSNEAEYCYKIENNQLRIQKQD